MTTIKIISVSANLGSNQSTVGFKVFDTSGPLHKLLGEYETTLEGRYVDLTDPDLIAELEALLAANS